MNEVFVFDCQRCGSHDELPAAGGKLSCTCDWEAIGYDVCDRSIVTTKLTDGEVQWCKTMAEVMGVAA